jgi:lysophospholipase L1-like esterase/uncharacterized protein YraI
MHRYLRPALLSALLVLALSAAAPVLAEAYVATTNANANFRPSPGSKPVAIIPLGTELKVDLCFKMGDYCGVTWKDQVGFVSGDLLETLEGGKRMTLRSIETARWQRLNAPTEASDMTGSAAAAPARSSSADIVAWGDSLTYGAGAGKGESYTDQARALLGGVRAIANEGIGGQTSTSIAARMNAVPVLLTLAGDAIPASGPVAVEDRSVLPVTNQGGSTLEGNLCGIDGTLTVAAKVPPTDPVPPYVFTREAPGSETACPADSRFVPADAVAYRNRTAWLWLGRNGAAKGHKIQDDIAAAVKSLGHERYLVGSILTARLDVGGGEKRIFETNAILKRQYGSRYVDALGALVAAADGSAEDQADAALGLVPRSLLSDSIHLNRKGYGIVAKAFTDAMAANGF